MDTDLLTERLHLLAETAPLPGTAPADDVRRGRRRRGARRLAAAAGAGALATVATVALGGTPGERAHDAVPQPAQRPPVADRPDPGVAQKSLADRIASLRGGDVDRALTLRQLLAVTDAFENRVAGARVGFLSVDTARSWRAVGADVCPSGWTCGDAHVRGADRSRWARSGTVHQLVIDFGGSIHLFTLTTGDERPGDVAWSTP